MSKCYSDCCCGCSNIIQNTYYLYNGSKVSYPSYHYEQYEDNDGPYCWLNDQACMKSEELKDLIRNDKTPKTYVEGFEPVARRVNKPVGKKQEYVTIVFNRKK